MSFLYSKSAALRQIAASFWTAPAALFFFYLALYLWSHIANFFNRDPLYYALQIESNSWDALFFDRHHLLYRPAARLWYSLWQMLGYKDGAVFPLQALSALAGALSVTLFFLLLLRLTQSRRTALCGAFLFGSSYALWRYAAEAYPHIFLPLFCCAAALALVAARQATARRKSIGLFLSAGLLVTLATLFYQTGILFVFPALVLLWGGGAKSTLSHKSPIALFLLPILLLVVLPFGAIAARQQGGITGLFHYEHGKQGWMGYGQLEASSLLKAPIGLGNLFVGEAFARKHLSTSPTVRDLLVTKSGIPLLPIDTPPQSSHSLFLLYTAALLALFCIIWLAGIAALRWKTIGRQLALARTFAVVWLLPYAIFAFWWFPENRQYWIGALAPLVLILSLAVHTAHRRRLLLAVVFLLFAVNLFGSILPDRRPENNPLLRRLRSAACVVGSGDLVVTISAGELKHFSIYLEYYLHCQTVDMLGIFFNPQGETEGIRIIEDKMLGAKQSGGNLFVTTEALGTPAVCRQIANYKPVSPQQAQSALGEFFSRYSIHDPVDYSGEPLVWRLDPAEQ